MGKFCKNCAAYIDDTTQFCPDCGKEVNQYVIKYCPNCGDRLSAGENFCKSCGVKIKEPEKESFLEKYKIPIIILAVIAVIAVVAFGAVSILGPGSGPQEIQVDSFSFNIPGDYAHYEDLDENENDEGIKTVSQFWGNGDDYVQIDVMYSTDQYVDAKKIARDMGGDKVNMLGYNGYYNELSDSYSFSFVKNNKLVTIYTNNMDVFDHIEVLS